MNMTNKEALLQFNTVFLPVVQKKFEVHRPSPRIRNDAWTVYLEYLERTRKISTRDLHSWESPF